MNELKTDEIDHLVRAAIEARDQAYAPHSHFYVGAALWIPASPISDDEVTGDQMVDSQINNSQIISGCNVENASYSLTICAERVAAASAVAAGNQDFHAVAIASVGGVSPCGACRQFLSEFGDMHVIMVDVLTAARQIRKLSQLLPDAFDASNLPMN